MLHQHILNDGEWIIDRSCLAIGAPHVNYPPPLAGVLFRDGKRHAQPLTRAIPSVSDRLDVAVIEPLLGYLGVCLFLFTVYKIRLLPHRNRIRL